jgi:hypothetical protein
MRADVCGKIAAYKSIVPGRKSRYFCVACGNEWARWMRECGIKVELRVLRQGEISVDRVCQAPVTMMLL